MTNTTAVTTPTKSQSVDSFIALALEKNVSIETMEKLFAMKEKYDAAQAKAAFVQALADFQHDCPKITKTKKVMNKDGRSVRYQYAPSIRSSSKQRVLLPSMASPTDGRRRTRTTVLKPSQQ